MKEKFIRIQIIKTNKGLGIRLVGESKCVPVAGRMDGMIIAEYEVKVQKITNAVNKLSF